MSQRKNRRHYTAEQKAEILRRHVVDKAPVSDLCDEYKMQPSLIYTWLRQLLENAPLALQTPNRRRKGPSPQSQLEQKVGKLEAKLAKKDEVIAEISEEFLALKKELGEL